MVATNFIYNFGQIVLDSSKKKSSAEDEKKSLGPEDEGIIEEYEGECEQCEEEKPDKPCPVCGQ